MSLSSLHTGKNESALPIGIFDSGIGGLSVLHEVLKILHGENFIYYADTDHVPYGPKPKVEVREYILQAASFFERVGVKALVLACNTATSVAANDLRSTFNFPVVGMEPAVKPAVERTPNKRVLVLATQLTLEEQKFKDLVEKVDNEKKVDFLALPELVEFAEQFIFDPKIVLPVLQKKLADHSPEAYGTIVLGCTHFPFFRKLFVELFSPFTDIIDGNEGTVRHLKNTLLSKKLLSQTGSGLIDYFTSGKYQVDTSRFEKYLALLNETGN
jgi:glutamate racemase